jgi:hypothetical protein
MRNSNSRLYRSSIEVLTEQSSMYRGSSDSSSLKHGIMSDMTGLGLILESIMFVSA